jgi:hypothetical protein
VPDRRTATAGAVYHAFTRMDGAKMFALGAMALAISQLARRSPILPRWLAPLGALLAAALVTSGLGYLLLIPGLASAVYVSGVLLLIFVSATGIALRRRAAAARFAGRAGRAGVGRDGSVGVGPVAGSRPAPAQVQGFAGRAAPGSAMCGCRASRS